MPSALITCFILLHSNEIVITLALGIKKCIIDIIYGHCHGQNSITMGFWAQTFNIFVFWVGLLPQWEVQEVTLPFTDIIKMLF